MKGIFDPEKGKLIASSESDQEVEFTIVTPRTDYLAHCIGCRATDKLALFAHRIEGQMVGWLFVCLTCWPMVADGRLNILIYPPTPREADDASRDDILLPG